jgi:CRISPR-associated exonuclease Cas4
MDEDALQLRFLNDFLYCPRRCALHRIEGVWVDNAHTLSGTISHETADDPGYRQSVDALGVVLRIERALPLFCRKLNLIGKADIVEFHRDASQISDLRSQTSRGPAIPHPVDYKLGPKRKWDNDDVQLCAQAICLEEMLGVPVPAGSVYHVKSRHRRLVPFDPNLRLLTLRVIEQVRDLLAAGQVPPADLKPQCEGCSLHALCMPELQSGARRMDACREELFGRGIGSTQRPEIQW